MLSFSVDKKNSRNIIITPMEKMKRILRHTEKEKKKEMINNYINQIRSGTVNRYQFYN